MANRIKGITVEIGGDTTGLQKALQGVNSQIKNTQSALRDVERLLKQSFRPEFLNRLDEIVFYKPLQKSEVEKILDLLIQELEKRLEDKHLKLDLTEEAKKYLIDNGYDSIYGARPLKRFVQKKLETLIARKILAQEIKPNSTIKVDYNKKELIIT